MIDLLRERKAMVTMMLLKQAEMAPGEDGTVGVRFRNPVHARMFEQDDHRATLALALKETTGQRYRVEVMGPSAVG